MEEKGFERTTEDLLEKKSIRDILMPLREKAEAMGLTEEDAKKEIKAHRTRKR